MATTYNRSLAQGILFTDEYQLTMAHLYYRLGLHQRQAQFDHFFRSYPDYGRHEAGYCINAGLEWLLAWMAEARIGAEELETLRRQTGHRGQPLFHPDFLDWLAREGSFESISMQAIPEGRVVHPNVPLTVVHGPLAMAQILESSLLNHLNYPTLVATKAARMRQSAQGQTILEFGMRRAQGLAANAGARAALIGGADYTSNVGISHVLGYRPQGTHGHSMVQVFLALGESELDAFRAYADVYSDDCLLLVDTVNTLESGIPNAIRVFEELRRAGHAPVGIRLDSGDLAHLSVRAAAMLDAAGFEDVRIVLSNQLDEMVIWQISQQIADEAPAYGLDADRVIRRLIYGVGTSMVVSAGSAALDGVYKLVAVQEDGRWLPVVKVSETPAKVPTPGHKKAWRLYDRRGLATVDLLGLADETPLEEPEVLLHHAVDPATFRLLARERITEAEELLVPVMVEGRVVIDLPPIEELRQRREADLDRLDPGVKRIVNPHTYHVSLTDKLWKLKSDLVSSTRAGTHPNLTAQG